MIHKRNVIFKNRFKYVERNVMRVFYCVLARKKAEDRIDQLPRSWVTEGSCNRVFFTVSRSSREQSGLKFIRLGYRFHEEFRPGVPSLRAPTTTPAIARLLASRVCEWHKSPGV